MSGDDAPKKPVRPLAVLPAVAAGASEGAVSVELSARRTGMSFQRTRMSADRTLMSVIRTSLSLIGFGFTIYQFFQRLEEDKLVTHSRAPRTFGATLVYLGVGMVLVGIVFHVQFMLGLRRLRADMADEGLIHAQSEFPVSYTLLIAICLLFIGIAAIVSVAFHAGPLS
ncbi:MAG: YidH family protein [Gemmatimonadaceae bacterium]